MHATTSTASSTAAAPKALKFLSFTLGQEENGIDIQKVQELRGYDAVTRIANVPEHIKGMVVDSVSDVITLTPEQIKPAPEIGSVLEMETGYLIGLGTRDERMLILVDIGKLMSSSEQGLIEKMVA